MFPSLMRTLVPVVVGLVLALAARIGLDLDDSIITAYATAGLTAGYYAGFRGLEVLAGRLAWRPLQLLAGVALGWARPPSYDTGPGVYDRELPGTLDALRRASGHGDPR
ncbi:hypothetical protein ACFYQA_17245 [Streptomyces sp. NPDC005774]|uniref:hypothetical protein n=1 Tax=Streptomyces sp. NPDC005774 TaxID=3364728 RepID=UPI0036BDDA4D